MEPGGRVQNTRSRWERPGGGPIKPLPCGWRESKNLILAKAEHANRSVKALTWLSSEAEVWAGSSAWYTDPSGFQAEERPVCKPFWSRDRKVAGSNPARSTIELGLGDMSF